MKLLSLVWKSGLYDGGAAHRPERKLENMPLGSRDRNGLARVRASWWQRKGPELRFPSLEVRIKIPSSLFSGQMIGLLFSSTWESGVAE